MITMDKIRHIAKLARQGGMSDGYIRYAMRVLAKHSDQREDRLARKVIQKQHIEHHAQNGVVGGEADSMGADCVKMHYAKVRPATLTHVLAYECNVLDGAEGPTYMRLISPDTARKISYSSRDLAMEAYEDGHSHIVHV